MLKIGWFSTGRDIDALTLFKDILNAINRGYLTNIEISYVFSNRELEEFPESDLFFASVKKKGIPLICFSHRKFKPKLRELGLSESLQLGADSLNLKKWREMYDKQMEQLIANYSVDLNLLAGYMLILSDYFVKQHILLNLHPSPPGGPNGTWQEVIWQLIKERSNNGGCMIHRVTEELDEGPPITYCTFPISDKHYKELWIDLENKLQDQEFDELQSIEGEQNKLFQKIREEEFKRETPLIIETLKAYTSHRLVTQNKKILIDGVHSEKGLCLNKEVNQYLRYRL